jgi:hypothetical protein
MELSGIDESQRRAARVAGITYLVTLATLVFSYFGIQGHVIVAGNTAETARNIMAHERLLRVSIACELVYGAGVVVLLAALYVILKPVHRNLAIIAAFSRLVYALMWVLMSLNLLAVLRLLSGADYVRAFEADQLQALVRLNIGARSAEYYVGLLFWGLASTVCSYLCFRSRYIPRALAAWGVISSAWCAACAFAFIIVPDFAKIVNLWWFDSPMGSFEIVTSFWLLSRGLQPSGIAERSS